MLVLNEAVLRDVLKMPDVIVAVEEGFRSLSRGEARGPGRLRFALPEASAVLLEMPAVTNSRKAGAALGTKIVSVFENNFRKGLETVQSAYLLLDPDTGVPSALMDGKFITGIRTAATSAVA